VNKDLIDTTGFLDNTTLSYNGGATIAVKTGGLKNAQIASDAAIGLCKLAPISTYKAIVTDANGCITSSSVTKTVLEYLDATSSVQTQLNSTAKVADTSSLLLSKTRAGHDYETKITAGTTGQYWRGDKSWQALPAAIDTSGLASKTYVTNRTTNLSGGGGTYYLSSSSSVSMTSNPADYYALDCTGSNVAVTFPDASTFAKGKVITIIKVRTSGSDTLKLAAFGGQSLRSVTAVSAVNLNMVGNAGQTWTFASNGVDAWLTIAYTP
jgi:hypothetical protein